MFSKSNLFLSHKKIIIKINPRILAQKRNVRTRVSENLENYSSEGYDKFKNTIAEKLNFLRPSYYLNTNFMNNLYIHIRNFYLTLQE